MLVLLIVFLWPLWFVLIASISDPSQVWTGNVLLLPKGITTAAYEKLFEYKEILRAYGNSVYYTVVGTLVALIMTVCCAYPLSRKDFMLQKPLLYLAMFTMYFSGGLIPNYLMMKDIGLLDTRWALIIPGAISVYNMLVVKNYFSNSIPGELQEAAFLDGANSFQYLLKVVIPLSKPVLAVVGLYYAVAIWNDYYQALVYINNTDLLPVQNLVRNLLFSTRLIAESGGGSDAAAVAAQNQLAQTLKYSIIVVTALPMLCVYPFIQKFFVKGIMVGSVKG